MEGVRPDIQAALKAMNWEERLEKAREQRREALSERGKEDSQTPPRPRPMMGLTPETGPETAPEPDAKPGASVAASAAPGKRPAPGPDARQERTPKAGPAGKAGKGINQRSAPQPGPGPRAQAEAGPQATGSPAPGVTSKASGTPVRGYFLDAFAEETDLMKSLYAASAKERAVPPTEPQTRERPRKAPAPETQKREPLGGPEIASGLARKAERMSKPESAVPDPSPKPAPKAPPSSTEYGDAEVAAAIAAQAATSAAPAEPARRGSSLLSIGFAAAAFAAGLGIGLVMMGVGDDPATPSTSRSSQLASSPPDLLDTLRPVPAASWGETTLALTAYNASGPVLASRLPPGPWLPPPARPRTEVSAFVLIAALPYTPPPRESGPDVTADVASAGATADPQREVQTPGPVAEAVAQRAGAGAPLAAPRLPEPPALGIETLLLTFRPAPATEAPDPSKAIAGTDAPIPPRGSATGTDRVATVSRLAKPDAPALSATPRAFATRASTPPNRNAAVSREDATPVIRSAQAAAPLQRRAATPLARPSDAGTAPATPSAAPQSEVRLTSGAAPRAQNRARESLTQPTPRTETADRVQWVYTPLSAPRRDTAFSVAFRAAQPPSYDARLSVPPGFGENLGSEVIAAALPRPLDNAPSPATEKSLDSAALSGLPDISKGPLIDLAPPAPLALGWLAAIPNARTFSIILNVPATVPDPVVSETEAVIAALNLPQRPTQKVNFRVSSSQVRYFNADDFTAAEALANEIGASLRDFTGFRPSPPDGVIEVYLAGHGSSRPSRTAQSRPPPSEADRLRSRIVNQLRSGVFQ